MDMFDCFLLALVGTPVLIIVLVLGLIAWDVITESRNNNG
jgi:hypothetical protein